MKSELPIILGTIRNEWKDLCEAYVNCLISILLCNCSTMHHRVHSKTVVDKWTMYVHAECLSSEAE